MSEYVEAEQYKDYREAVEDMEKSVEAESTLLPRILSSAARAIASSGKVGCPETGGRQHSSSWQGYVDN